MSKKLSTTEKVRRMIDQGFTNKAIIERLGIRPQAVYNIRYQVNKARGLGAIGQTTPHPVVGIGAPHKRKPRKVRAGTGITSVPANDVPVLKPTKPYEPMSVVMIEPPSLWQRIKGWFNGRNT